MEKENDSNFNSTDSAYLDKLEFTPEKRNTWLNFFVSNFRVVILLIILISGWGIYSFSQLPKESNPEVKIATAIVSAAYPGVSPSDIEELVTKKIETAISGVSGINKITSTSANSFSTVVVEFDANQNIDDSVRKLRDKLPTIRKDIPLDAKDPEVREISLDDTPIVTFAIVGPYDDFTMRTYGEKIQDELEKIPGIREVNLSGGDQSEFEVAYDPQKLAAYNITTDQANQSISATNKAIPAGNFEGEKFNYPIRSDGRFYDAKTLGDISILHTTQGSIVYLKDIADVKEKAIEKTIYSRFSIDGSTPQNAVTIQIVKRTGGSVIETVESARSKIETMLKTFPGNMTYSDTVNQADRIKKDFDQLTHDFLLTLILVVGILFLIVGLKEAFVAGIAIPLVFFVTFGVMQATGTSLNFLSIFALLLSLGLLVDDAIVVVSATKQYMKTGKYTPEEAVLLVLHDFKIVLISTTFATVWAFLPLLMASGIIGQFIKSIPITVSVTLISSLLIALMINHPLAAVLERIRLTKKIFFFLISFILAIGAFAIWQHSVFGYSFGIFSFVIITWMLNWYFGVGKDVLEKNKILVEKEWSDDTLIKQKLFSQGDHANSSLASKLIHGIIHFDKVLPIYEKYLRMITRTRTHRMITLFSTLALFIFATSLPIVGIVKSEFFPPADGDALYLTIRGPVGLNLDQTDKITREVENRIVKNEHIINFSTLVGNSGSGGSSFGGGANKSNTSSITIKLTPQEERDIKAYDIANEIRDLLSDIQDATITVSAPRGGPPSGSAFQAQISGENLQTLDKIAQDLKPIINSISWTINSDISLKDAPAEYTFDLDNARMELYDLNATVVGSSLRNAISGTTVTTVIRDNKDIDVVARFGKDKIPDLETIQNLQILNTKKQPVFIKDVATVKLTPSVDSITRIDQKRTILLTADVSGTTNATEVIKEFQEKLAKNYTMPEGYAITYGGENEQNNESVLSIIRAMAIAAILIISTLVIQFNSFKKAIIVLVTLPLALIGVFIGMALLGVTLSFPGLIGILALFGIVVKNAIILIDKINLNIKTGIPFNESIIDAGKSRLEAIFITSIVTIAGIIPITLSNATWTALGSAVIFGLSISSFFTLFIIPTLYMTFIDEKERF
ncbi:MAG: Acriflavin resistance protein [Candidatus Moranbacteria bacterium GW2011_GWD2_36_12]|nr:MAG: Acriflavin resistance protein [Candidatus Moranbacteria bacterium GW2011_GWD2_36_12]KKQ06000.1 MAG: Acriflavin resistance protein [Candidatus Moranbacteria bacterium GW2011_GWE2_36_40]